MLRGINTSLVMIILLSTIIITQYYFGMNISAEELKEVIVEAIKIIQVIFCH